MVNLPKTLSDHQSLVGIVRFPKCTYTTNEVGIPIIVKDRQGFMSLIQNVDMANTITGQEKTSGAISIPKSAVTDFYPYSYYVLTDGEAEPLIMQPQYMAANVIVKGKFALSHQPVERYYVAGYKGDNDGRVYNITNLNQMMLPTATNEGLSYMNANANTIAQTRYNQVAGTVLNGVSSTVGVIGSLATGNVAGFVSGLVGGVSSAINGMNSIKETDARNKDTMLTPSTISSFGTPSTRQAFNTDSVRLIRYTVKDNVKNKINNFIARYGNKYNNYAEIDLKSYKGYVKFISPDVDSGIDNIYINKIISILERGVYVE